MTDSSAASAVTKPGQLQRGQPSGKDDRRVSLCLAEGASHTHTHAHSRIEDQPQSHLPLPKLPAALLLAPPTPAFTDPPPFSSLTHKHITTHHNIGGCTLKLAHHRHPIILSPRSLHPASFPSSTRPPTPTASALHAHADPAFPLSAAASAANNKYTWYW